MNFSSSSSEENVFLANTQRQPVFKAASAVLPPPQPFGLGLGSAPTLPVPTLPGLGFNSKNLQSFERGFDAGFEQLKLNEPAPKQNEQFPVFHGRTNNVFGMLSNNDPAMMFMKVQRSLELSPDVDYNRVDDEPNLIRGRVFGELNNVEYEVRVFSVPGSNEQSYVEFNRWCGDGWEFSNFVTRILIDLDESGTRSRLPATPKAFGLVLASVEDLAVLIEDIQQAPQDVAEHAAAELAMQTKNDACKNLCDGIEGFCPRILELLVESTNCAIVRSLLICLANVAKCDGLTRRILSQSSHALQGIAQKWNAPQRMCGGLFTIAPSRQVTNCVHQLLMV